jgi:hypothetical protein
MAGEQDEAAQLSKSRREATEDRETSPGVPMRLSGPAAFHSTGTPVRGTVLYDSKYGIPHALFLHDAAIAAQ